MSLFIIVGRKSLNSIWEDLYVGNDGVAAAKAGADARETGEYASIGKVINPSLIPLPTTPEKKFEPAAIVNISKKGKK